MRKLAQKEEEQLQIAKWAEHRLRRIDPEYLTEFESLLRRKLTGEKFSQEVLAQQMGNSNKLLG